MFAFLDLQGRGLTLLDGIQVTLMVGVLALCIAICFGLIGAWAKLSQSKVAHAAAETYTTVIRGVPELVLLLLVYYGSATAFLRITEALGNKMSLDLSPFAAGTITIGFIYGAFATECFRGAFLAIPRGQIEAAKASGMSRVMMFRRIIFPQMMRFALPGLGNIWLILIKATSLMSAIQAEELVRKADIAAGATRQPFTWYFMILLIFLGITMVSMIIIKQLEGWAEKGVRTA